MYDIAFPQRSNRESWVFVGLISDLDNNPINLSLCSMAFAVRDKSGCQRLLASTANGKLTIIDVGTFRWAFTLQEMQGLCSGTYDTGLTLTNDDGSQTIQLSVGPLAILDGVVPAT